jgi:hypothetical protein
MKSLHRVLGLVVAIPFFPAAFFAADSSPAAAVKRELDMNGQLVSYVDFETGWKKVAEDLQGILKDTPMAKKDMVGIVDASGLAGLKAMGLSSTATKDGYDNRIFLYMPGGRAGFFAAFPGEPALFHGAKLAPADADFFFETRVDVTAVMNAVNKISIAAGENKETATEMLDLLMKDPNGFGSLLTFQGDVTGFFRFHPDAGSNAPEGGSKIPLDAFFRVEGGGAFAKQLLGKTEDWKKEETGSTLRYTKTEDNVEMVVWVEGDRVTAGFPKAFVEECVRRKDGLADSAAFKQAVGASAAKGHCLLYVTPHAVTEMRRELAGPIGSLIFHPSRRMLRQVNQLLDATPVPTKPMVSVLVARPDGILIRQSSPQSLKIVLPLASLLPPDFIGQILRGVAISYADNRAEERQGEVLLQRISGDLDVVRTAVAEYFSGHSEETTVTLAALREALPEKKLPELPEISGDTSFTRGSDQWTLELKNGRSVVHLFALTPAQRSAIEANLKMLSDASLEYLLTDHSYASYHALVDAGLLSKLEAVSGEDYDSINLELDTATLTLRTPGDQEVSYTRDPAALAKARRRLAEQQIAIERNLSKIFLAAQKHFVESPDDSSVSFERLSEQGLVSEIKPVAGEDYARDLSSISKDDAKLSVSSSRIGTVVWTRPLDPKLKETYVRKLTELEAAVSRYFARNPKAEVVVSGELLPQPATEGQKENEDDAAPTQAGKVPDLSALVIRRDYKTIKVSFEGGQEIAVPRTSAK